MIKKASLLFLVLFFCFHVCDAQTKQTLLNKYFLGIQVSDFLQNNLKLIETSPLFRIDSIQKTRGYFSSYKGQHPFEKYSITKIVVLLQKRIWQDSVTKNYYDTSSTYSMQYFFDKNDKKGRNDFYKQVRKEFMKFYPFADQKSLPGNFDAVNTRFTNGRFDTYAELTIYKGYAKHGFHYVTVRFDKRTHYQIENPTISIQIF